ncbi:MAG: hypothetical protein Ct9H90mP13_01910 [Pseudomonadota bacterium]|nr:MAG: hypothetical protein Ct9H90mP13_01910 [Pseudomonadota bacterium]
MVNAIKGILNAWQDQTKLEHRGEFYTHTLMTPLFNPGPNPMDSKDICRSSRPTDD